MDVEINTLSTASSSVSGGEFNSELISADLAANDALWRILSLVDPFRIDTDPRYRFATIYAKLRGAIAEKYCLPPDDADAIAKPIAGFLSDLTFRLKGKTRLSIDSSVRAQLVDSISSAFCWYCGARFSDASVDSFISKKQTAAPLPRYIDFVTSRGSSSRDLQIEVDHVMPIALGGSNEVSNLRLSCGWCNKHKRELKSLYDANAMPTIFAHPRSGSWLLPAPYWILRVLGTRRRCEWTGGCPIRIEDDRLFVAPRALDGAMTPGNLGAFCQEHDPIIQDRLIPNSALTS